MIVDSIPCAHDAKAAAVSLDGFMESTERSLMLESCRLKVCFFLFQSLPDRAELLLRCVDRGLKFLVFLAGSGKGGRGLIETGGTRCHCHVGC